VRTAYITTSWDDGHPLDFRVAELLAKYGLTGTFYVPRRAQTEVMTEAQIQQLGKHFEIGAHTLDHVYLDDVPRDEAAYQITASKDWVEDVTGTTCKVFCFPGGKYRRGHVQILHDAGFQAARTVELLALDIPPMNGTCILIPTTLQAFPHQWLSYAKNSLRRGTLLALLRLSIGNNTRDWPSLARKMAQHAIESGGVFHLWGHSWEIEEQQQWRDLESVFAFLSQWQSYAQFETNSGLVRRAD